MSKSKFCTCCGRTLRRGRKPKIPPPPPDDPITPQRCPVCDAVKEGRIHQGRGDAPEGLFCSFECFGEYARGYYRAGDASVIGERLKRQKGIEYARWAIGISRQRNVIDVVEPRVEFTLNPEYVNELKPNCCSQVEVDSAEMELFWT